MKLQAKIDRKIILNFHIHKNSLSFRKKKKRILKFRL